MAGLTQGHRVRLEGVGQQALGARIDIGLMDGAHQVRSGKVPELAAFARRETGGLQFGTHGAVHEQDPAGLESRQKARHVRVPKIAALLHFQVLYHT